MLRLTETLRLALVPGLPPRLAERVDVARFDVEGVAGRIVVDQRRAHQIHAQGRPPRTRSPPRPRPTRSAHAVWRMGLDGQQARRVREHRPRVRLGEPSPCRLEEQLGVAPRHVGVGLALRRLVAEVAPPVDDLLGRPTDAELQPAAGQEVGGPGVLPCAGGSRSACRSRRSRSRSSTCGRRPPQAAGQRGPTGARSGGRGSTHHPRQPPRRRPARRLHQRVGCGTHLRRR